MRLLALEKESVVYITARLMTSTFFQRLLIIILLAGTVPTLWAQEYKYEIGGMAGGAFYMATPTRIRYLKE